MKVISIPGFTEPVSCWTHLIAAGLALVGLFFLIRRGRGNAARVTSLSVFSFSLIFLYSMSGVYHMLDFGGTPREVLQRLDHAAIWVLIAGTFTPIHTILFRGAWRWGILLLVWAIAITGLVLEVVFFQAFPEWLALTCFLSLGWIGALTGMRFVHLFRCSSVKLLIWGGLFYSIGAVIDFIRWPTLWPGVIGPHEIFHIFVVAGSGAHWLFIWNWAEHPVANQICFQVKVFPKDHYVATARGEHIRVEAQSIEELRKKVQARVREKYHDSIEPAIRLQYSHEELLGGGTKRL